MAEARERGLLVVPGRREVVQPLDHRDRVGPADPHPAARFERQPAALGQLEHGRIALGADAVSSGQEGDLERCTAPLRGDAAAAPAPSFALCAVPLSSVLRTNRRSVANVPQPPQADRGEQAAHEPHRPFRLGQPAELLHRVREQRHACQ
jgi:hypothetical protein